MSTDDVRRFYALVDAGDFTGATAMFDDALEYHRPAYEPICGRAGLARFFAEDRPIREGRHTLTAVVADGRRVAVHGAFDGVLRDGRPVSLRFADFFVLAPDGRFTRRDTYFFAPLV
jgi:ketosteroid isomerase-like protein